MPAGSSLFWKRRGFEGQHSAVSIQLRHLAFGSWSDVSDASEIPHRLKPSLFTPGTALKHCSTQQQDSRSDRRLACLFPKSLQGRGRAALQGRVAVENNRGFSPRWKRTGHGISDTQKENF